MSQISIQNNTADLVRVAIYRRPVINPTLATTAWRVSQPPPGGSGTVSLPTSFTVYGRYSTDPGNPSRLDTETQHLDFSDLTAVFSIDSIVSEDRRAVGATINQSFDNLVMNEVRIINNYGLGVLTAIAMDGDPLYSPQVIWPGGLFIEDLRGAFYAAVVSQPTYAGQRLIQEEISQTQIEVLESSTLVVSGSMWKGYSLTAG